MYNTKFIFSNGKEVYPGYLSNESRQKIRDEFHGTRGYMKCGCRPDGELYYRISEDLKIYPEHKNYKHDIFCCRYKSPSGEDRRRTAYVINEENGDVMVFTSFDPCSLTQAASEPREQDNEISDEENENIEEIVIEKSDETVAQASERDKEPNLSLNDLIRSMNVDVFTEKILNGKAIDSKEKFSVAVFHRMKKIRLVRARRHIGELTLEKDGCKFIYLPYAGVKYKEENGMKRSYLQTKGPDGKVYNNFIFPETMAKALKEFAKNYGIEPNDNTMVAGFQYLKKSKAGGSYKVIGRLNIFQVSDVGIYCRNMTEQNAYNSLEKIAKENNSIKYWIPPEDDSVGAIVEVKGKKKKILIIFRHKKDERLAYDKTMYVPLVADHNTQINETRLYELLEDEYVS